MGMFDELVPFADEFEEDQPFMLEEARMGSPIQTDYGKDAPVQLRIGGKWYSVFGMGLANQVGRMEPGDLPARVKLTRQDTKSGQTVKLLVPAEG